MSCLTTKKKNSWYVVKMTMSTTYRRPRQLKKRWHVDFGAPKIPFVGPVHFRAGSGQAPAAKALTKRSLDAEIRRIERLSNPNKVYALNNSSALLTQETFFTWNPLGNIPIGTGEQARISSDIFVKKIKLRAVCISQNTTGVSAQNPILLRVMWVRSEAQYLSGSAGFTSSGGMGSSDLLLPGLSVPSTGLLDSDKVVILSDRTYRLEQSNVAATQVSNVFELDCPQQNFQMCYTTPTSNYSTKNKQVYCVVSAFSPGGVIGTTNQINMVYSATVEFTDSR